MTCGIASIDHATGYYHVKGFKFSVIMCIWIIIVRFEQCYRIAEVAIDVV